MARATTAARGRRRQARGEARESILAAADEFLRERPFRELTIDELMKRAGLSRTLFYRHFDDLSQLVMQLLWTAAAPLRDSNDETLASGAGPDALREGLHRTTLWFAENGPLLQAVADAVGYDEQIEQVYEVALNNWFERMRQSLQQAAAGGHIVPVDPALAEVLVGLNERYLLRKLGRFPQEDPQVVEDTLWAVWHRFLYGPDA
jgi:AcrR family transcriptional regulator